MAWTLVSYCRVGLFRGEQSRLAKARLLVSDSFALNSVCVGCFAARIQSKLSIRKPSEEDMKAPDSLAIPDGEGRTADFTGD